MKRVNFDICFANYEVNTKHLTHLLKIEKKIIFNSMAGKYKKIQQCYLHLMYANSFDSYH